MHADDLIERPLRRKPERFARLVSKSRGQPLTILTIIGSGSRRISLTAFSPATRRNASICSPTVADRPGIDRLRRQPSGARSMVAACSRKPTAERGLACQCRTSSLTGRIASCPASGSRRMLEKKPDAALFGLPGRMQMVGRRMPMPSKKPRLRIVGQQQLPNRLLRSIAGQRRREELVADLLREGCAEHRDRGGEHDARLVVRLHASCRIASNRNRVPSRLIA